MTRTLLICAALLLGAGAARVSDLKDDEVLILYPSFLTRGSPEDPWRGFLHGMIQEYDDGATAAVKRAGLRAVLGLHDDLTPEEAAIFRARAADFIADVERGKTIVIEAAGSPFASEESGSNGHFRLPVTLTGLPAAGEVRYAVLLGKGDERRYAGTLCLVPARGLSVISDIDDTVKHSDVEHRDELLTNTFLRPYRAVEGMAGLYRSWAEQGASIHFLTGSPWQLFPHLWSFFEGEGFPGCEIQMRDLRLKDSSSLEFFDGPMAYKAERLREMLGRLPGRRFVLVGDSGEQDPEIYAAIAAELPGQVRGIFIRAVREEHADRERYRKIFAGLEESRWIVFREASELPRDLGAWLRRE